VEKKCKNANTKGEKKRGMHCGNTVAIHSILKEKDYKVKFLTSSIFKN
jgi:hypothetical protein